MMYLHNRIQQHTKYNNKVSNSSLQQHGGVSKQTVETKKPDTKGYIHMIACVQISVTDEIKNTIWGSIHK